MSLSSNLALSLVYETLKMHKTDMDGLPQSDHAAGYHQALRYAMGVVEDAADRAPEQFLRRPSKPVFEFDTEGSD